MSRGTAASPDVTPPLRLELPAVLQTVNREYDGRASYTDLWRLVVEGVVPATKNGRRWMVDPAYLPLVAEALGLTRPHAA
jgi:hypothetical protein